MKNEFNLYDVLFFSFLAMTLGVILCSFVIHIQDGSLPNCAEDEYLYPQDYRGPGRNVPGDYVCVHIDELR